MSLSLGLNLIFTTLVVFFLTKTPLNLDQIRNDYLKDIKTFYNRGCLNGAQDYVRDPNPVQGFNQNSPMNWCSDQADQMDEAFLSSLYHLGR